MLPQNKNKNSNYVNFCSVSVTKAQQNTSKLQRHRSEDILDYYYPDLLTLQLVQVIRCLNEFQVQGFGYINQDNLPNQVYYTYYKLYTRLYYITHVLSKISNFLIFSLLHIFARSKLSQLAQNSLSQNKFLGRKIKAKYKIPKFLRISISKASEIFPIFLVHNCQQQLGNVGFKRYRASGSSQLNN
eukprot:TRINITY_DN9137_c1_g1_i6.p1 TRINITY_DN9137_c1_g1~~TRINITY_DN9137_c1_g1_i6.p1  ORF type:complete len:186 (+),score=-1.73 TRINITY_DN9137_c1_g1_i6:290-847(+)